MEVSNHRKQILFFSRGKGRGHAVPDAAIAQELVEREPDVAVTFVSYSVGAKTLRELGWNVIDLELPEDNLLWETLVRMVPLFKEQRPTLVVSHEEVAAIPLAKAFDLPAVFLTDWFLNGDHPFMQALSYADEIVFADSPGYYAEPPYLKGKISYVGTVFRRMEATPSDRLRRRGELGIPEDAVVITVVPGGADFHSEARAPIFDLVSAAFGRLPYSNKRLVWIVAGRDHSILCSKAMDHDNILVIQPHSGFTATLLASDLVITKGNRTPIFECEAMGIRSLSISFGLNPVDEFRIIRVPTNTALAAHGLSSDILGEYIVTALAQGTRGPNELVIDTSIARLAAVDRIRLHL